jgi:hypothetical protein
MTKVIIHTNENGGVSVTYPSPEFLETNTIHDVKEKDTPEHSIIVDESILPNDDNDFFNAWVLNSDDTVSVDINRAKTVQLNKLNTAALIQAQSRNANTAIGLTNTPSDEDWITMLNSKRTAISSATTTAQLRAITLDS